MVGRQYARWYKCVFITAVPIIKLFEWGEGDSWRTCATRDDEACVD